MHGAVQSHGHDSYHNGMHEVGTVRHPAERIQEWCWQELIHVTCNVNTGLTFMEVETVEKSPMDLPSSAAIAPCIALQQCDHSFGIGGNDKFC